MKALLARLGRPGWGVHLLASAPFVAAFVLVPAALYLHAGETWDFTPALLLRLAALGLLGAVAAVIVLRLIAVVSVRAAVVGGAALFALGLWIVLAHVYAPIAIGPLDGEAIDSQEPLALTLREAGFAVLALVVLLQLARGRWQGAARGLSLALVLISTGYLGAALVSPRSGPGAAAESSPDPALGGNVYHFVLDTMQTDAFLHLLERTGAEEAFQGFQLFENNISNYRTTLTSSASYFTGTLYRKGRFGQWRVAWKNRGLFESASDAGYRIWMYAPYKQWRQKQIDRFWYMRDIYERESGTADSDFADFALVWLLSLVPNPLTDEAVAAAERSSDVLYRTFVGDQKALTGAEGLQQVASVMMVQQALRDEDLRADRGEYVYVHPTLPHGPMVIDRECRFVGREASDRRRAEQAEDFDLEGYLAQGTCALRLIEAFLDRLRALGRYDAATIVIHGDTGLGKGLIDRFGENGGPRTLGFSSQHLVSMVNALLMIKRPHADAPFEVVARPTQLIDLYPTLVDVLGLPPPEHHVHGRSVFAPPAAEAREVRFAIDPKVRHGPDLIEVLVERPDDLEHSRFRVVGPPTERARRREEVRKAERQKE